MSSDKAAPPPRTITLEPAPAPVRVEFAGTTLAESDRALILREETLPPAFYIPRADVRWEALRESDRQSFCPYKGTARYWSVQVGDREAENAVWGYPEAIDAVAPIRDCVAFYWNRVDAWYLDDRRLDAPNF
ncbi:MAG: DUF427 domain-containing protein [Alphaproteobacteria bacterium]|nr:DUF427 domain-containing protein [Alphaproteobacteria bacterium]MCB9928323.1 DUF427 domain-containing protein [Alphaproteobacteria bacterium]